MSTPKHFADRELRTLTARAEKLLRTASEAIGPGVEIQAQKRLRDLFSEAPQMAASTTQVGGCGDLTYQDLFAIHMMIERQD